MIYGGGLQICVFMLLNAMSKDLCIFKQKTESGDSGLTKVSIFNLFLLITKLGYEATSRLVSKRIFGRTNSLVFMI